MTPPSHAERARELVYQLVHEWAEINNERLVGVVALALEEAEKAGAERVLEAVEKQFDEMFLRGDELHYDCWKAQWRQSVEAARVAAEGK